MCDMETGYDGLPNPKTVREEQPPTTCKWESDGDQWNTECGDDWLLLTGTENSMKYCPMCGKLIA